MQTHSIQFGQHKAQSHSDLMSHAMAHAHPATHGHVKQTGNHFSLARHKSDKNNPHDALVKQTQKWVAQTFYGEMLKQMRNSPFKSKMMDGGDGGKAFTEMFDQKLADKMAAGPGGKLVDSIVSKIESKQNAAQAKKAYEANQPPRAALNHHRMPLSTHHTGTTGVKR